MRILRYTNWVFMGMPIVLGLLGMIEESLLFWAVWGLLPLGILQGVSGVCVFALNYKNIAWQIYVTGLMLFGILCFFETSLALIPPIPMALYYTFIIEQTKKATS